MIPAVEPDTADTDVRQYSKAAALCLKAASLKGLASTQVKRAFSSFSAIFYRNTPTPFTTRHKVNDRV
jgi:hypothetical protein